MTEPLNLRPWLRVLPLLVLGIAACSGKVLQSSEGTGGTSAGGATAAGGANATGGSPGTGGNPGDYTACAQDSDCTWTEISIEILKPTDCMCLYGCPYIAVNQQTSQRRSNQYTTNCEPKHDGRGVLCGIDDCALPPALFCLDGNCAPRK